MTGREFIEFCSQKTGVPKSWLSKSMDAITQCIAELIGEGESVKIYGFGTFTTRRRPAGKGFNPKTGKRINVPPTIKPYFKPGIMLTEAVEASKDILEEQWQHDHKDDELD